MRSLKEDTHAIVDLGIVLMIGISFASLMVIAFIIWTLRNQLLPYAHGSTPVSWTVAQNNSYWTKLNSTGNITAGFDSAINLVLIAITVFILAIAIASLLMLRGR